MSDFGRLTPEEVPPAAGERRSGARRHLTLLWNLLFRGLRGVGVRAERFYTAVGIFLIVGIAIAIAGTLAFAELGEHVRSGGTQAFDVAVLKWLGAHHTKLL